jgi:mannose-6-phosphate isomerase-like protein (cupin superfamily)
MARAGQTLESPIDGTRAIFYKTAVDTNGTLLEFEFFFKPHTGKGVEREHFHITFAERYEILAGVAAYQLNGVEQQAQAGETVVIPANTPHLNPWNAGLEELHVRQTITMNPPNTKALQALENFIETLFTLARQGQVGKNGLPKNFLQTAMIFHSLQPDSYAAGIPIGVQRVLFGLLAGIGRLLGYRAHHSESSVGMHAHP